MDQKHIVIFYDEDEKTILEKKEVGNGEKAEYSGKTPEKPSENGISYTFVGWKTSGNLESVTDNLEAFAIYEENSKIDLFYELSEKNAENSRHNEVFEAGKKISKTEKATRNMTLEQKKDLVNQIKTQGSVNLDKENEHERD